MHLMLWIGVLWVASAAAWPRMRFVPGDRMVQINAPAVPLDGITCHRLGFVHGDVAAECVPDTANPDVLLTRVDVQCPRGAVWDSTACRVYYEAALTTPAAGPGGISQNIRAFPGAGWRMSTEYHLANLDRKSDSGMA